MGTSNRMSIYSWFKLFDQTGCVCKEESFERRPATEAQVYAFSAAFFFSARESTARTAGQLNMAHTAVPWHLKFVSGKHHVTVQEE
jgi:hypothetical protein